MYLSVRLNVYVLADIHVGDIAKNVYRYVGIITMLSSFSLQLKYIYICAKQAAICKYVLTARIFHIFTKMYTF